MRIQIDRDERGKLLVDFDTASKRPARYVMAIDMPLYRAAVRRVFARVMAENAALRRGLLARAIARRLAR